MGIAGGLENENSNFGWIYGESGGLKLEQI